MSMITEQAKRLRDAANRFDAEGAEPSDGDLMREASDTIEILSAKVRKENGFIFPENPTNGDMIETMFPNCVKDNDFCGAVITSLNGETQYWKSDWWNSPYKRGDTE